MALNGIQLFLDLVDVHVGGDMTSFNLRDVGFILLPVPHIVTGDGLEDFGEDLSVLMGHRRPELFELLAQRIHDKSIFC